MTDYARRQVVGRGIPLPATTSTPTASFPHASSRPSPSKAWKEHVFEDARKQDPEHPFNQAVYQGASVLVVGQRCRPLIKG